MVKYFHSSKDDRGRCWSLVTETDNRHVRLVINPTVGWITFWETRGYLPSFRASSPMVGINLHLVCVKQVPGVNAWRRFDWRLNTRTLDH